MGSYTGTVDAKIIKKPTPFQIWDKIRNYERGLW
jgi:hypothetical protein